MIKQTLSCGILVILFISPNLEADVVTWVGTIDDQWNRSENWDAAVPGSNDLARIEGHANSTLATSETIDTFSIGADAELTITATGQLNTLNSYSESEVHGVLKNSGFLSGKIYGDGIIENAGTVNIVQYLSVANLSNTGAITGDDIQNAAIVNSGTIDVGELYYVESVTNSSDITVRDLRAHDFVSNTGTISSDNIEAGSVSNNGYIYGADFTTNSDLQNEGVIEARSFFAGNNVMNTGTLNVDSLSANLIENQGVIVTSFLYDPIINQGALTVAEGYLTGENYTTIDVANGGDLEVGIMNAGLIINDKSHSSDFLLSSSLNNDLGVIQFGEVTNREQGNSIGGVLKNLSLLDGDSSLEVTGSFLDGHQVRGDVTFSGIVQGGFEIDGPESTITFVESTVIKSQFGRDYLKSEYSDSNLILGGTLELLFDELLKDIEAGDVFDLIVSKSEFTSDFSEILYTGLANMDLIGYKIFEGDNWLYRIEAVTPVPEPRALFLLLLGLQLVIYRSCFRKRK